MWVYLVHEAGLVKEMRPRILAASGETFSEVVQGLFM